MPFATGANFLGDLGNDHPIATTRDDPVGRRAVDASRNIQLIRRRASPGASGATGELGFRPECSTCHQVHTGPDPALSTESRRGLCLDCHDAAAYMGGHATPDCLDCHTVHGGNGPGLLASASVDLLCRSCHEGGGVTADGRHLAAPPILDRVEHALGRTVVRSPVLGRVEAAEPQQAQADDCLSCHGAHR